MVTAFDDYIGFVVIRHIWDFPCSIHFSGGTGASQLVLQTFSGICLSDSERSSVIVRHSPLNQGDQLFFYELWDATWLCNTNNKL